MTIIAPVFKKLLPPLESGDVLPRDEFERRYHAMPETKKAELIEGVVHMPSPVRWEAHSTPHVDLAGVFWYYCSFTKGCQAGDNGTVRLDVDNEPQPDITLIIRPECGGRIVISEDGYLEGAPDLVAEIAASTVSIDVNQKLKVYRRNQVREYMIWRVLDEQLDWFIFQNNSFEPLLVDEAGVMRSQAFPGLWLNVNALLRGDSQAVLSTLMTGLASAEHATFVEKLQPGK